MAQNARLRAYFLREQAPGAVARPSRSAPDGSGRMPDAPVPRFGAAERLAYRLSRLLALGALLFAVLYIAAWVSISLATGHGIARVGAARPAPTSIRSAVSPT